VTGAVIGLSGGERDRARLEHAVMEVAGFLPQVNLVCTHELAEEGGYYCGSLFLGQQPDPAVLERLDGDLRRTGYSAVILAEDSEAVLGDRARVEAARQVAKQLAGRESGRAIEFLGRSAVPLNITVAELIQTTAIDEVVALGADVIPASEIQTNDFLRPRLQGGRLVLHLTALAGGRFRPFEVASPHQCCEHDH
jgi:hypothetical protein